MRVLQRVQIHKIAKSRCASHFLDIGRDEFLFAPTFANQALLLLFTQFLNFIRRRVESTDQMLKPKQLGLFVNTLKLLAIGCFGKR